MTVRLGNKLTLNMQCIGYMAAPYFLYKYLVSLGQSNGSTTSIEGKTCKPIISAFPLPYRTSVKTNESCTVTQILLAVTIQYAKVFLIFVTNYPPVVPQLVQILQNRFYRTFYTWLVFTNITIHGSEFNQGHLYLILSVVRINKEFSYHNFRKTSATTMFKMFKNTISQTAKS
uniref:Uncharacterized protein n=1 Tax=Glossina austeni TaxID=7395 RepID=A0A1A9VX23_GLOAU